MLNPFVDLPKSNAVRPHARDLSHAARLCSKCGMAEKPANVGGYLFRRDVQINDTVFGMSKLRVVKAVIAGKERRLGKLMKQRHEFIAIFHAEPSDVNAYPLEMYPPPLQLPALIRVDVFIQEVHVA